jgi:acyl-CoA thioester hydrolase
MNAREDHLKESYNMDLNSFYQQGLGWVVGGHEIRYLKPALYNERICIHSSLLDASEAYLLVEMLMYNEKETHLKAILWTSFIPVDIKTGKKRLHSPEFMQFIDQVWDKSVDPAQGLKTRLATLQNHLMKA